MEGFGYNHIDYDLFAWLANRQRPGYFIDMGCQGPYIASNVRGLLERGWHGRGADIVDYTQEWNLLPSMKFYQIDLNDPTNVARLFDGAPKIIDFLSFDLDESGTTVLQTIDFDHYKFRAMTIEHDEYRFNGHRKIQHDFLINAGYIEVLTTPADHFWVHPDLVSLEICNRIEQRQKLILNNKQACDEIRRIFEPGQSFFEPLMNHILNKNRMINIPDHCDRVRIDVGLSTNAPYSERWLAEGPDNLCVFGFEPVPECLEALYTGKRYGFPEQLDQRRIGNQMFIIPAALSDTYAETVQCFVADGDLGCSSINSPLTIPTLRMTNVPQIRLSDFFDRFPWNHIPDIEFLKIDTQGHDLKVLQGTGIYLEKIRLIQVEIEKNLQIQYANAHTEKQIDSFLHDRGFIPLKNKIEDGNKQYYQSQKRVKRLILDINPDYNIDIINIRAGVIKATLNSPKDL